MLPDEEYGDAHIVGALNMPLKEWDRAAIERLDRERPVVVYCWGAL